jgi:hypothetical protein
MVILAYTCAILIGISLGLLGSGGSILTVPILVYLLHFNPVIATGYSLFIVGLTSMTGAVTYMRNKMIDYKTAFVYAVPSFISVYLVRRFLLPVIPQEIIHLGSRVITKEIFIMLVFAVLMISAAFSMIRKPAFADEDTDYLKAEFQYKIILLQGLIVGAITGLVSVGGGFLIIPSLVLFARVPIKLAVGTSLVIIATNSFVGFIGELHNQPFIDYGFLLRFSLFSIGGIFMGSAMAKKISNARLKPIFGWFILFMGVYIVVHELLLR